MGTGGILWACGWCAQVFASVQAPLRRAGSGPPAPRRRTVDWPALLRPGQCFSADARVAACSDVPTALLVQMRLRDAICDAVRDAGCALFGFRVEASGFMHKSRVGLPRPLRAAVHMRPLTVCACAAHAA